MEPGRAPDAPKIMSLNVTKAGMTGLDKEKINTIIFEASKDSDFFKNQQTRQKRINERIERIQTVLEQQTDASRREAMRDMDIRAKQYDQQRKDLTRLIVHVDMDMFFAAVEILFDPSLASVPMAVGSMSMLSTSNYEARKYGIRPGMAGFIAKKLCPQLKIVRGSYGKYRNVSRQVMEVIKEYDPNYHQVGLDETYLDITDFVKNRYERMGGGELVVHPDEDGVTALPEEMWDLANEAVQEMRTKVFERTKLTCSAGIAHNKRFAKICSDFNKPNGQFCNKTLSLQHVQDFLDQTPVRKVPGVGAVAEQILKALDIHTCRDLYEKRDIIRLAFHPSTFEFYMRIYLGLSSNHFSNEDAPRKSKGEERTISSTADLNVLIALIEKLARDVCDDVRDEALKAKTVTLKIKWANFQINDRSQTLPDFTDNSEVISKVSKNLLRKAMEERKKAGQETKIRLLGVRVSNFLDEEDSQLFSSEAKRLKQRQMDEFVARVPPTFQRPAPAPAPASAPTRSPQSTHFRGPLAIRISVARNPNSLPFTCDGCTKRRFSHKFLLDNHVRAQPKCMEFYQSNDQWDPTTRTTRISV